MSNRRQFLQWTGLGAAASLAVGNGIPDRLSAAEKPAFALPTAKTFELGLASYSLRHLPLDQVLVIANRLGLKHLCVNPVHLPLTSTPEQIERAVARVKAAGIDLYGAGVIYMPRPADVDRAFDYARATGIRTIVAMPSPQVLPLVDEKVQKYDLLLAIHNHGPDDKTYPTPGAVYKQIKHLDGRIGLCIDIDHTTRAGVDPCLAAEQFADRLLDVHLRDVTAAKANGKPIEAGRGVIDIPRFLRTLSRIRYTGIVAFEFEKDPSDPLPGLAESVGYVRGVLAATAPSR